MRIATWNVERLGNEKHLEKILSECNDVHADILVLTETDKRIVPDYKYCYHTPLLKGVVIPVVYRDAENRVSVFTNYRCINKYSTYDDTTSICVELETEKGNLLVYGTVMGILGSRRASYREDLVKQLADIKRLSDAGHSVCIIGDYNCSFCDGYYYTKYGRNLIRDCFEECNISILTSNRAECIDHIAISDSFIDGTRLLVDEWNYDKAFSDHKGIVVEII